MKLGHPVQQNQNFFPFQGYGEGNGAKKLNLNNERDGSNIYQAHLPRLKYLILSKPSFRGMCVCVCVHAKSLQSCLTFCVPMDCSLPGSSVQGILQARMLEWVAMPSSRVSSQSRDQTQVSYISCIGRWVLYYKHHVRWKPIWGTGVILYFVGKETKA